MDMSKIFELDIYPIQPSHILIGQFILKVKALLWTAGDLLDTIDWFKLMFMNHLLESCMHQILSLGEHFNWATLLFNAMLVVPSVWNFIILAFFYLSWAWPKPSQPIVFSIVLNCYYLSVHMNVFFSPVLPSLLVHLIHLGILNLNRLILWISFLDCWANNFQFVG